MSIKHFMVICLLSCSSLFASAENKSVPENYFKIEAEGISNSSVSGNIISAVTQNPLQFVTISLVNADTKAIAETSESLYNGYFKFKQVPKGNYHLIIKADGYKTEIS